MIPLFRPYVPSETSEEVTKTLSSGCLTEGKKVAEFEQYFRDLFHLQNTVTVNSGTSALETAYELIGIRPGDEVIVTPLTCTATNIPLLRLGAKLVWADILKDTLCIDPEDVKRKITHKTKAIVQVHLGGVAADVGKQYRVDSEEDHYKIPVVSDACQALGIFRGDYTCCSFQAIKHITTADGGMLCCMEEKESERARLIRWFGIDRTKRKPHNWTMYSVREMMYDIEISGTKKHMNDLNATMGIVGLNHYHEVIRYRRFLYSLYEALLEDVKGIELVGRKVENTYWLATVLVENRDNFARMLYENGVETNTVHRRNDEYTIFGGKRQDLPVMNEVDKKYLSLPLGMHVSEQDVRIICSLIKKGW